jgi:cytochrome c-type biogenesis protein CcmH/NrfG
MNRLAFSRPRFALALIAFLAIGAFAQTPAPKDTAGPPDPLALGNAFYDKGDWSRAAEQYRIVTHDTTSALRRAYGWFNLGNCQVQTNSLHRAVVSYRRAVESAPSARRWRPTRACWNWRRARCARARCWASAR